jgi:photosystem II stability/assembly factor-like uncharacterized protein
MCMGGVAPAHDSSAYGGLFRSRDLGASWLNADVGLFLSGAVSVAVSPVDPNSLILGTDGVVLVSRSGGRRWDRAAPEKLSGAVFAAAFSPDGGAALCSTPGGVFRRDDGEWQLASAPAGAAPSRAIVYGVTPGSAYLIGQKDFYRSEDGGRQWTRVEYENPQAEFTALIVEREPQEFLLAIISGQIMGSADQGRTWKRRDAGLPGAGAEALASDPFAAGRLWVSNGDRLYRSDDRGMSWRNVGRPLPEPGTSVRGIAASADAKTLLLATQRGVYRSVDVGQTWVLTESNLPVHLEAGVLARDPSDPNTIYVGFALIPYGQIWKVAIEGGSLLGRLDMLSLVGGAAFLLLLGVIGSVTAAWLVRRQALPNVSRRESTK